MFKFATVFSIIAILAMVPEVAKAQEMIEDRRTIEILAVNGASLMMGDTSEGELLYVAAKDDDKLWERVTFDEKKKAIFGKAGVAEWDANIGSAAKPILRKCSLHRDIPDIPGIDTEAGLAPEKKLWTNFVITASERENYLGRCWTDQNKDAVYVVCGKEEHKEADCIPWGVPATPPIDLSANP